MFEGLTVAMVTPFRGGELDLEGTARLIEFMLEGGVENLVVSGSTGEAATCSVDERRTLWRFVRERVAGRVPLVAGTGTNSTSESVTLTHMAEEIGLDGVMLVTPYYNKPTAKGQIAHFSTVARSTKLPVILYNVPSRTGTNTLPEVFEKLDSVPNIVAIKYSVPREMYTRLTRLVGASRAIDLLITGRTFSPDEALQMGLVSALYPAAEGDAHVRALAARLAAGPALALAAIKRCVYEGAEQPLEQGLALEQALIEELFRSKDAAEGLRAFVEKREPAFVGA